MGRWSELKLLAEAAAGFDYEFDWMTKEVSSLRRAATPQAILELIAALSAVTAERDALQAQLERAYANYNQVSYASTERGKQIDQLRAEVEALRNALKLAQGFLRNQGHNEEDPLLLGAIDAALAAKEAR